MIIDKKRGMIKLLYCVATIAFMSMIVGCKDSVLESKLNTAELIIDEQPDSAYAILNDISIKSISNRSQKAKYALLLTMAQYKCYIAPKNDSLINIALDYYKSGEYLQKSLIFKGAIMAELGYPIEAIEWYKKAETATPKDDYAQLGYINPRMGYLYRDAYISNGHQAEIFQKSLDYYKKTPDSKRQLICLTELGKVYFGINRDSCYSYMKKAINYAKEIKDSVFLIKNMQILARYYTLDSMYSESKQLAFEILKHPKYIRDTEVYNDLAIYYAVSGKLDSAYFFFNMLPTTNFSARDSVVWLTTKEFIKKAEGNYNEAFALFKKSEDIADDILRRGQQQELYLTEKKYDKTLAELEKSEAQRHAALLIVTLVVALLLLSVFWIIAQKRKDRILNYEQAITELRRNHLNEQNEFIKKLDEARKRINSNNDSDNILRINRLRSTIYNQIELIKELLDKSAVAPEGERFLKDFRKTVATARLQDSIWLDLRTFIDESKNNVISKIKNKHQNLNESELNFIGLMCCNFSMTEIMICMGYTNVRSALNLRRTIEKKINLNLPLEEYILTITKESET